MATRTLYYEKENNGSLKVAFTMEEAKMVVSGCRLVQTATGYIGRHDDLVKIERYEGKYGKGYSLHYGSFKRSKDHKTFHYVDYYVE